MTTELITGGVGEHQGCASASCTLIQVSNVVPRYVNGKSQLLHPAGISYCDQMARNPERVPTSLELDNMISKALAEVNEMTTLFVFVMMVNGVCLSPQYLSSSICSQSNRHVLSSWISKCRKVILILCPSSTPSVHVYTNINY